MLIYLIDLIHLLFPLSSGRLLLSAYGLYSSIFMTFYMRHRHVKCHPPVIVEKDLKQINNRLSVNLRMNKFERIMKQVCVRLML